MTLLFRESWTEPGSELVPSARRLVRNSLKQFWDGAPEEKYDDIELVTGELLANAIFYAKAPLTIEVNVDDNTVRIEVNDHSPDLLPPPPPQAALAETGRGLMLVALLSSSWGWEVDEHSKTIWVEFAHETASA